jgi:hypothetical protein
MSIDKLIIDIKNCYGIESLDYEFEFGNLKEHKNNRTISIYAPNGTMKTSLTKVFKDIKTGNLSEEQITNTKGTQDIYINNKNTVIKKEQIHVIDSYIQNYESKNITSLLLNKDLKEKLENIEESIKKNKNILSQELNKLSINLKTQDLLATIIQTIKDLYKDNNPISNDDEALIKIKDIIKDFKQENIYKYSNFEWFTVFNEKVIKSLTNIKGLEEYFYEYKELIKNSKIFQILESNEGIFDNKSLDNINKNLTDNNFFKVKGELILHTKTGSEKISNSDKLDELIKEELKKIENNTNLAKIWKNIEKTLDKNGELRSFTNYIKNNLDLIPDLKDLPTLQKKVISAYFLKIESYYNDYIESYNKNRSDIKNIQDQAKDKTNKSKWDKVIDIFNNRFFYIPYEVYINNETNVILGAETPYIQIRYKYKNDNKNLGKEKINSIFSEGEKRTLYLLHCIFDLEELKNTQQDTILVVDDILDSFDYKNKNATLEYIDDIMSNDKIYLVSLTHNFDLYRSIFRLLQLNSGYIANKNSNQEILFKKIKKDDLNPFKKWLSLENEKYFICSIPLIRNLLDYTENKLNIKLTDYLHYPLDSKHKDLNTLFQSVNGYLNNYYSNIVIIHPNNSNTNFNYINNHKCFYDLVQTTAETIKSGISETNFQANLQDKIIISIALRLLMEKKIIDKLEKDKKLKNNHDYYSHNQARTLVNELKKNYTLDPTTKGLFDIINMLSSNYIHINSFIYEPLLDINIEDLKNKYTDLCRLDISNIKLR